MALSIADHGYVLETGKVVIDKPAAELLEDDDVREFYLGLPGRGRAHASFRDVKHYRRRKRWSRERCAGAPMALSCRRRSTCPSPASRPINGVSFDGRPRRAVRDHRPERRRQDLDLQRAVRRVPAAAGSVELLEAATCSALRPHRSPACGIARTFQNIELFSNLTVLDNLMLGRHQHIRYGVFAALAVAAAGPAAQELAHRAVVEEIIDFLELEQWRQLPVGLLPYGVQKRVELGRALAMEPKLLLLDEPVAGMNLEETEDMARYILDIRDELTSR